MGRLIGTSAPIDGDPGFFFVEGLDQSVRSVTLILADEIHHGVLPARIVFEDCNKIRCFGKLHCNLRICTVIFAVLRPFYERTARLRPGKKCICSCLTQIDLRRLHRILCVRFRSFLSLGVLDIAQAICINRDKNAGIRHIEGHKVIGFATIDSEKESILSLLRDGDSEFILAA